MGQMGLRWPMGFGGLLSAQGDFFLGGGVFSFVPVSEI